MVLSLPTKGVQHFFLPRFHGIQLLLSCLIATTPIRAWQRHVSSDTQPHCFLTQRTSNPEASHTNVSEETPCTWQPWLARNAFRPPQESLVQDETRISLPAKPSLTQTTLGVTPRTSQSRLVMTEPGREPRVSGGTAGAAVQCP